MKNVSQTLIAAALIAVLTACGGGHRCTVDGTLDDDSANGKYLYLVDAANNAAPIDSALVNGNHFSFSIEAAEPQAMIIYSEVDLVANFIAEPGKVVIEPNGSIGGTTLNDRLQAYNERCSADDIDERQAYIQAYFTAPSASARAEAKHLIDSLNAIDNERTLAAARELYEANPNNLLGGIALLAMAETEMLSFSTFDSLVSSASPVAANYAPVQRKLEQMRAIDATSAGRHYTDIVGVDGKLSDLIDGHLALVDFYASWCAPCRAEIRDNIVPIWNKYGKKGLVVVGLNVWEGGTRQQREAAHQKVMADLGITYPQLVDSTTTATTTYGVQGIPEIMLIGPDGTILERGLRSDAIEEAVKKNL